MYIFSLSYFWYAGMPHMPPSPLGPHKQPVGVVSQVTRETNRPFLADITRPLRRLSMF